MGEWENFVDELNLDKSDKMELDLSINLVRKMVEKRNELGLSQRQLAKESGVRPSTVSRLEKYGTIPRVDTLFKLLAPLSLTLQVVDADDC